MTREHLSQCLLYGWNKHIMYVYDWIGQSASI